MSMTGMDYSMGGGKVKYRELAVAAAGQTYAQQMTQLNTVLDTLTDEQRLNTIILIGGLLGDQYFRSGNKRYSRNIVTASKVYNLLFSIDIQKFYYAENNTVSDLSNNTNNNIMCLMMLDVVSE